VTLVLSNIREVRVDSELFNYTHETLREYSSTGVEALALWAGRYASDAAFDVLAVRVPAQRAIRSESGLAVLVDADELHRLNVWLYQHDLRLIAQIHTHPTDAYHSELDDAIPIITSQGGLSLVIPDFARGAADLATYAIYRLGPANTWDPVSGRDVTDLVKVTGVAKEGA
jgi:hypothetical protein